MIISGGENISSLEVDDVLLHQHPGVLLAAVVAKPDTRWGDVPCAFIELREGYRVGASELQEFCRSHRASFKTPKVFSFGAIPKTSTGKVPKAALRDTARALDEPLSQTTS